ncbi:MAG: tRNA (N6-threonylcarbamoyladenosine(37)-N6)-methyltransferase TrmO [Methanomicrobiaceae archaeon]|nr:tRNA (N6-threonylcarbamoyladenosine(37)-N6)-methyltransferase TrmO [Methanomicrobiaceae archaeon]
MTEIHSFGVVPVGVIHSPVQSQKEMPALGLDGEIELFPFFAEALEGIQAHSHILVIGWMHRADRTVHRAVPRKISPDLPEKGVFALRSPSRPNPISVTVAALSGVREGRFLDVSFLDLIDKTPVLDIKPYQAGIDCVFSATGPDRSGTIAKITPERCRDDLVREAVGFHGEYCPALAVAVRMMIAATRFMGGDLRREEISCSLGPDPCINDALIGITGARFGTGRLIIPKSWPDPPVYAISGPKVRLEFSIVSIPRETGLVDAAPDEALFLIRTRSE